MAYPMILTNRSMSEVLVVFRADNEAEIGKRLGANPWTRSGILSITRIVR